MEDRPGREHRVRVLDVSRAGDLCLRPSQSHVVGHARDDPHRIDVFAPRHRELTCICAAFRSPGRRGAPPVLTYGTINTGVLLVSTIPNPMDGHQAERENLRGTRIGLVTCLVFGTIFPLAIRGFEFGALQTSWITRRVRLDRVGAAAAAWAIYLVTDFIDSAVLTVLMFTGPILGPALRRCQREHPVLVVRRPVMAVHLRHDLPLTPRIAVKRLTLFTAVCCTFAVSGAAAGHVVGAISPIDDTDGVLSGWPSGALSAVLLLARVPASRGSIAARCGLSSVGSRC